LLQAAPPHKESYPLCIKLRNCKREAKVFKDSSAHRLLLLLLLLLFIPLAAVSSRVNFERRGKSEDDFICCKNNLNRQGNV
jgi:hypothetical protein